MSSEHGTFGCLGLRQGGSAETRHWSVCEHRGGFLPTARTPNLSLSGVWHVRPVIREPLVCKGFPGL
jgi:hypothetical protein